MYHFNYQHLGGTTRVLIRTAEDLRHLGELDQKKWTVLSCPASGLEIADETLQVLDLDHDGQIRVREVIATSQWLCSVLHNPITLFHQQDQITISNIEDAALAETARKIAPETITLADLDAHVQSLQVPAQELPAAPYPAEVIAAYRSRREEYAAYFQQLRLQQLGLAVIAPDTVQPGISEADFIQMGQTIDAWDSSTQAIQTSNQTAMDAARAEFIALRKLLVLSCDFVTLLRNFVTLDDFYDKDIQRKAIFQAGTLVIDQRICHLCMKVNDMAKHDAQAALSGMFLVYCDCVNQPLNRKIKIVAAVTAGEINNLTEGKNAIFYDRTGVDYDATITKIIDNPISVMQAFWSPYRKFGNWITDLINTSASEKNDKAFAELTSTTEAKIKNTETPPSEDKKSPFDIAKFAGIFAAIGMALGYLGAFVTNIARGIEAMPWWHIFIWIAGLLLTISGPAMVLAAIKLRRRNIAPLLNANGWAVNADSLISIPFGATLTEQVQYPLIKPLTRDDTSLPEE